MWPGEPCQGFHCPWETLGINRKNNCQTFQTLLSEQEAVIHLTVSLEKEAKCLFFEAILIANINKNRKAQIAIRDKDPFYISL